MSKKLIVILGPTASGKSELAVNLAKKINGEVISADSRQVYRNIDIGTGKITKKEMKGVPHYLLDVADPKRKFSVVQYQRLAKKELERIHKRDKLPILCGGTGFYIQAVVDGIVIPEVKPDWKMRKNLEKKSTENLYELLKKISPERAKNIDQKNKRRLIRALEIAIKRNKPVPLLKKKLLPYPVLMIGFKKENLEKEIEKRFFAWLKKGLIREVKNLRKLGVSWKRIEEFGIHYRFVAQYLQKKITRSQMIESSLKELQNYAKRQITWFKKDKRIFWVKNKKEAEKLVKNFLSQ